MRLGISILCALVIGIPLCATAAQWDANQPPVAELPAPYDSGVYVPPLEPYIPGPGWFAEEPGTVYPPTQPPTEDWGVALPFKYYPQGNAEGSCRVYEPSFLPTDLAAECYATPPPCYLGTIYFDVLVLDRGSNLESTDVIYDSFGNAIANTADLNLDTEAGIRFGILLPSPSGTDWMGEYFGINAFQDSLTRNAAPGVFDDFFGAPGGPYDELTLQYESKLDSLEFMVRSRQSRRLAPLAGIRYVRVDESLNSLSDPAGNVGWFSDSHNDLFGLQFGCQGLIAEYGPWRLETIAKAGPYINDIDVDVRALDQAGGEISRHVDHWHTSFVGDLRIGLICRLGPRMNFRIGYQGLWIEGLAIAPNQVNNVLFSTGLESVDLGGVIYQGGYLGLDLSW